jgi:hypothetical protein
MDLQRHFTLAKSIGLVNSASRSFANNKMDFATFTSAMWVFTKFFVSASSAWQVRAVWLAKVANRTTRRVENGDPNIDAGIFGWDTPTTLHPPPSIPVSEPRLIDFS